MTQESVFAGIDVAKDRLDLALRPSGTVRTVAYDAAGISSLVSELQTLGTSAVALESTGGLELPLAGALAAASLPVAVVNPRQVRDFAKATGPLRQAQGKTDALDAQVIAHFAEAVRPAIRPLPDSDTQELHSLNARRTQVVEMLVAEKNRLGRAGQAVRPRIRAHIEWLEQELKDIDRGLRDMLRCSPVWRERDDLLRSVPGVGPQLSPELAEGSAAGGPAGTGYPGTPTDSRLGGSSPDEPGQRDQAGQENGLRRPSPGACRALHGSVGGDPAQSGDPRLLPAAAGGRQDQETGADRLHAQAADHPQQHGKKRPALEPQHDQPLTFKTAILYPCYPGLGLTPFKTGSDALQLICRLDPEMAHTSNHRPLEQ